MTTRTAQRLAIAAAALLAALWSGAPALGDAHEAGEPPASGRTPAPPGAAVYFITPADGAVVTSPLTVRFGLRGMGVAPAAVDQPNTGHHHLVIDAPLPDMRVPIPANDQYRHFGGGQTEMQIELPPGDHTLQLVLGDYRHVPFDPPIVSERITITVE